MLISVSLSRSSLRPPWRRSIWSRVCCSRHKERGAGCRTCLSWLGVQQTAKHRMGTMCQKCFTSAISAGPLPTTPSDHAEMLHDFVIIALHPILFFNLLNHHIFSSLTDALTTIWPCPDRDLVYLIAWIPSPFLLAAAIAGLCGSIGLPFPSRFQRWLEATDIWVCRSP